MFEANITNSKYQITKIVSTSIIVINVYRSEDASSMFLTDLQKFIEVDKTVLVCGDFNFCYRSDVNHPVKLFFKERNFTQVVTEATHREGRIIDHTYVFCVDPYNVKDFEAKVQGCYYSDHDKITTYFIPR